MIPAVQPGVVDAQFGAPEAAVFADRRRQALRQRIPCFTRVIAGARGRDTIPAGVENPME